jgi:hypothetical protein
MAADRSPLPVTGLAMASAQGTSIVDIEQDYPASAWRLE